MVNPGLGLVDHEAAAHTNKRGRRLAFLDDDGNQLASADCDREDQRDTHGREARLPDDDVTRPCFLDRRVTLILEVESGLVHENGALRIHVGLVELYKLQEPDGTIDEDVIGQRRQVRAAAYGKAETLHEPRHPVLGRHEDLHRVGPALVLEQRQRRLGDPVARDFLLGDAPLNDQIKENFLNRVQQRLCGQHRADVCGGLGRPPACRAASTTSDR